MAGSPPNYDNKDFTGRSVQRIDPMVKFNWWYQAPATGLGLNTFSVRWTRQVTPRFSEAYTFHFTADDVRLWLNGRLLIDKWALENATEWSSTPVALVAGQPYDIKIEYFQDQWAATAELRWSSASTPKEIIPQDRLTAASVPSTLPGSDEACTITNATFLGSGGAPDWSPDNSTLVYHKWDENGVYQLHTSKPDGTDSTCLSCQAAQGAPATSRHKVNSIWHPSGKLVIVQGEADAHPLAAASMDKPVSELMINGLWTNLYAVTPDGRAWYRLTDVATSQTDGAISPRISRDGTQLL
jgi:hypothetical protein